MNMKNKIKWLSALALSTILLYSCTDNEPINKIATPEAGSFKIASSDSVLLLSLTDAGTHSAVTLQWDSLVYGISTPVTFTIQMDSLNGDFSTPIEEEIATGLYKFSYTDSVLNKRVRKLKLKPTIEGQIKVRVKANLSFNSYPVYSNAVVLKVTPYLPPPVPMAYIYISGMDDDWSQPFKSVLVQKGGAGDYEGYYTVNFCSWNWQIRPKINTWDYFGFVSTAGLTGTLSGLNTGTANHAADFPVMPGYYRYNVNLEDKTYTITQITSFCVTGDFNSWSLTANPMTYDATTKIWSATCDISAIGSGIQIIGNGNWSFKYGDDGDENYSGELNYGGANIKPTSTGTKTVRINLSNPEKYTYTIQ
jgi:hypothetical protein